MADQLQAGDTLPSMTLRLASGGEVALPDALTTPYGVVLFCRATGDLTAGGSWPRSRRRRASWQS
jgi:hypothetical protein